MRGLEFQHIPGLNIEKIFRPGATLRSLRGGDCFSQLAAASPNIVVLFLGGNDITGDVEVVDLYQLLLEMVQAITLTINPAFGVYVIEPEWRTKPRGISASSYNKVKNSLARMIKRRKEMHILSLHYLGINTPDCLASDGVHINSQYCQRVSSMLERFLRGRLFGAKPGGGL